MTDQQITTVAGKLANVVSVVYAAAFLIRAATLDGSLSMTAKMNALVVGPLIINGVVRGIGFALVAVRARSGDPKDT